MSKQPILEVRDLKVVRNKNVILKQVDWRIQVGEHWVILGANGSGKTSLLNVLLAYLTPTDGTVSVMGSVFGETPWHELRMHIGVVSATIASQLPEDEPAWITVVSGKKAILDYVDEISPKEEREARRILRKVEAAYLADRPWGILSQGERQRVLIGRALIAQPKILILDEPGAGLDPVARETFMEFLNRLSTQPNSPALVLVTHHVEEIPTCFTHALLLKKGSILKQGSLQATLNSQTISDVFSRKAKLQRSKGRYRLQIESHANRVV